MNNIEKGYQYELYINNYLNTLDNIKIAYLWKDIPEYLLFDYGFMGYAHKDPTGPVKSYNDNRLNRKTNNINKLEDIGSDIIYINQNDECIIVQCKNYTKSIKIEDLSGFFFIMCKHIDKIGEIYYTNKLSKKILLEYNDDDRIKLIKKEIIQENHIINIIKPYDYQDKIIKLANDYYKNNNTGIISCPCGTGKTLISCYIAMNYDIGIMITPLKQYAKQNCDRFKIYENDRKSLLIDSDGTRNITDINEFIKNNSKILLSVTYKSCDIICEIIDKLENVFIIFDEFHNFSYNNIYDESDNIYKLINNDNIKKLYLSATPRIYELEDNNDIDVNEIFGDYIYKMSFNEAIDNKYISDYELYLPIFGNDSIEEINNLNIHENYLLKLQFLIEAIKMQGNLKVIVYVRTHEEIDTFISEFNKINKYYAYDVDINKITCNDSYTNRTKILDDFSKSNKINILLSVHILDEAIDIPSCNSIYMTYVSSSKIKNIQRMSRAMRYQNNKIAKIFLFCKDIDESISYISSIREYDTDFIKKINYLDVSENIKNKKERLQISNKNVEKNKIKILGIKLYRSDNWNKMLEKVKKYIDEHNKRPSSNHTNIEIKKLGRWIDTQLKNYKDKNQIMQNKEIYNKWTYFINNDKYKIYFEDKNIIWCDTLEKVKMYIDYNNKIPSSTDKNNEIKLLGTWISNQQTNYKNNKDRMTNIDIYNKWTEFINDNKYKSYFEANDIIWINTLDKVKKYINENKKKPSNTDINKDIKVLSKWISHQLINYKNQDRIMKNIDIYNKWTEFINDNQYKIYFEDNNIKWFEILEKVKIYIDNNNKRPSSIDKNIEIKILGTWISNQQNNYKNNKASMLNEEIYNKWVDFINDDKYKIYYEDIDIVWNKNLDKVKRYIDDNNKRPSNSDINKDISSLGIWISNQIKNYKNKKMSNEVIYNNWIEFINDNKYKIYFEDNNIKWFETLEKVKIYIDVNNMKPSTHNINIDIKILGTWIGTQLKNYKNKKEIMKNENIYNKWTEFINNNKYKIYFEDNNIKWLKTLKKVLKYIDDNNKRPNPNSNNTNKEIKKLGKCIGTQLMYYKNKQYIMSNEDIYNKWINFINNEKYKKYF